MKFIVGFICGFFLAVIAIAILQKNADKTSIKEQVEKNDITIKRSPEEPSEDKDSIVQTLGLIGA